MSYYGASSGMFSGPTPLFAGPTPLFSGIYGTNGSSGGGVYTPYTTNTDTSSYGLYSVPTTIEAGQATLADLINKRGEYIENTSAPYKQELFNMLSYNNPNVESDAFNAAIPQIQRSYRQAVGMENRTAQAAGINLDDAEQKLMQRMSLLKQEETIGSAAKQIKQRLKERELTAALGSAGSSNEVISQAY